MLDYTEIEELLDDIRIRVIEANRRGTLDTLLENMKMSDLIRSSAPPFDSYKNGKIVVIGQTELKEDVLRSIARNAGIDKDRLEFCLDYKDAKSYNYKNLQYNPIYSVVLVGPIPHKTGGTGESSSVISEMEKNEGYPKVVRLMAGNELKITKTNFKNAVQQLINEGYIE